MKKSIAAIAILGSAAMAASASASLLIYEPFDPAGGSGYASGSAITGQVNTTSAASETWLDAGTVTSAVHQIGSPGLTSPAGFPAASGNMADLKATDNTELERLNIPNAFNTDLSPKYGANSTLYYSLLIDVPSVTGLTVLNTNVSANNDAIIAFNNVQGSQAGRPSAWNGELVIKKGATTGTYDLGVRASTPTTAGSTYFTSDLTPGTTHLVVVQVQLGANPGTASEDTDSMWLDPTSFGGSAPTADGSVHDTSNTTDANVSLQSILIGAGIASGSNPNDVYVDEIRVGDTWADVTAVPEPTTIGLAGVAALGLLKRRRRMA